MTKIFIDRHGHEISLGDDVYIRNSKGDFVLGSFVKRTRSSGCLVHYMGHMLYSNKNNVFLKEPFERDYPEEFI